MSEQLFLLDGTALERDVIARERGVHPRDIRLVRSYLDICGRRGGEIIFGSTGLTSDFGEIVAYAKTHGITVP